MAKLEYQEKFLNMLAETHSIIVKESLSEYWQGEMKLLSIINSQDEGKVLPSELGARLLISSARIAAMLNSLEKKGLIERQIDLSDRRKILVSITDEGKEYIRERHDKIKAVIALFIEELGEEDTKELERILGRLTQIHKKIKIENNL